MTLSMVKVCCAQRSMARPVPMEPTAAPAARAPNMADSTPTPTCRCSVRSSKVGPNTRRAAPWGGGGGGGQDRIVRLLPPFLYIHIHAYMHYTRLWWVGCHDLFVFMFVCVMFFLFNLQSTHHDKFQMIFKKNMTI